MRWHSSSSFRPRSTSSSHIPSILRPLPRAGPFSALSGDCRNCTMGGGGRGVPDAGAAAAGGPARDQAAGMSDRLAVLAGERWEHARPNEPLARHTTFRIGGPADWWVEASTAAELVEWLGTARQAGSPVLVLGHGSNVLARDGGIRG